MSIKIHHGPPGSYKTASAVQWDLAEAVERGDIIVTNVRGLTLDKIHAEFDSVAETVDVIFLDLDKTEDREKIKRWFHWAPKNAFFLWDEAAVCFPKSMRPSEIDSLVYKTPSEASEEGRPHTWEESWDMHRHYGWNVVLCLVNIKKLRDDIRGAAEMAIKHKNLALMGTLFKGKFLQGWHSAESNGSAGDFYQDISKKMPKDARCWRLYESTKTKEIKDTTAGFNLFKSPKVMFYGGGLILCALYAFRGGAPANPLDLGGSAKTTTKAYTKSVAVPTDKQVLPVVPQIPTVSSAAGVSNVVSYVRNLSSLTPLDIVKKAREEPIISGCISTDTKCICFNRNGVKLDLTKTYCELIQKSGFYYEKPVYESPQDESIFETVKGGVSDLITPNVNPFSRKTLDDVQASEREKEQRYLDNVASRPAAQDPITNLVSTPIQ